MSPENQQQQEAAIEKFPSIEEIRTVFSEILQGKEYEEIEERTIIDEKGVSRYEAKVLLEGGRTGEYNFQRAKYDYRDESLPASARFSASIHATFYDSDGDYDGADTVANFLDGVWTRVGEKTN